MERLFGCDSGKRALLLETRHFDLLDVTVGQALDDVFTVVYTMRGPVTWLVTAWPANRKERAR